MKDGGARPLAGICGGAGIWGVLACTGGTGLPGVLGPGEAGMGMAYKLLGLPGDGGLPDAPEAALPTAPAGALPKAGGPLGPAWGNACLLGMPGTPGMGVGSCGVLGGC